MKTKIKNSISTMFLIILFNLVLTTVFFFLLWYWVTPKLYPLIPGLSTYLQGLDDENLLIAYEIYYTIGSALAIFPSTVLAYRMSKKRRKKFIEYSGGLISYGDGIRYHLTEYGIQDGIVLVVTVLLFSVLTVSLGDVLISKLFPLPFHMCRAFGLVLGLLISTILTISSAFLGVFVAQKKWRAEHFIGE